MPTPRAALVLALTVATLTAATLVVAGAPAAHAVPVHSGLQTAGVVASAPAASGHGAHDDLDDMEGMDMTGGQMPAEDHVATSGPVPRPVAAVLAVFIAANATVLLVAARWRRRERQRPRHRPRRTPATA